MERLEKLLSSATHQKTEYISVELSPDNAAAESLKE